MPTYPVLDIYETVQGEGVAYSGYPITLIRFGTKKGWENAHLQTTRPAAYVEYTLEALADICKGNRPKMVHLTGDEPLLNDIPSLVTSLAGVGLTVSLDTCGVFSLPPDIITLLRHISVGPKPGLHVAKEWMNSATEFRFYTNSAHSEFQDLIKTYLGGKVLKPNMLIIPYTLSQEEIDFGLEFCIENDLRFHIPLYRALPTFDANRNGGAICQICLLQDQNLVPALTFSDHEGAGR